MADRTQHDPEAEYLATRRALEIAATENLALRTALAEVVGYCINPRATVAADGTRTITVDPDAAQRWQAALAGTPADERPEPAPVLRGTR